jgi:alcohol dehydrogenase (cytochrome c)
MPIKAKLLTIVGALIVIGAVTGGALSLGAPAGAVTTELNTAYKGAATAAPAPPPRRDRRAPPLAELQQNAHFGALLGAQPDNTKDVGKLKVLCTYDVNQFAAFESGLIMVDNALIGTTQFDIFSLNPATCAENWRTHKDYPRPPAGQPRRRLPGRHTVSRHPERASAGL